MFDCRRIRGNPRQMSGVPSSAGGAPKRVLVVEDDPSIQQLLSRALQAQFQVSLCDNGTEALTAVREQSPDLVLLDVNLPGMDGFAIAAAMKDAADLKSIPIIFLTARGRPTEVIQGIQAGARHYITKPFKIDELLGKIRKVLTGKT